MTDRQRVSWSKKHVSLHKYFTIFYSSLFKNMGKNRISGKLIFLVKRKDHKKSILVLVRQNALQLLVQS